MAESSPTTMTTQTATKAIREPTKAATFVASRLPTTQTEIVDVIQAVRYRLKSPDYISYYKRLQDTKVQQGNAYPRNGVGVAQFEFLRRCGLEPEDRLLDIGCGDLRGGQYAIDYLEPGHYTGMDISAAAIGEAVTHADRSFPDQDPRLFVNDDLRFRELESDSVDVALAQSVFTHLPESHIRECLEHIPRVLADDGVFYATFHGAERAHVAPSLRLSGSDSFRYPFADLQEWAAHAGLTAEQVPYSEYPTDEMDMAAFYPGEGQ